MTFSFRTLVSLLIVSPAICLAQVDFDLPDDFSRFYAGFREAVISTDSKAISDWACFPFEAHEVGELVDRVHKVRREKFIQLDLGQQLLADPIWKYGPVVNGKVTPIIVIYETQADFIRKTPDIRHAAKLDAATFNRAVRVSGNKGNIFNLELTKKEAKWCWSGSTFDWDIPGLNVKN